MPETADDWIDKHIKVAQEAHPVRLMHLFIAIVLSLIPHDMQYGP
jgi:hypothetical protein